MSDDGSLRIASVLEFHHPTRPQNSQRKTFEGIRDELIASLTKTDFLVTIAGTSFKDNNDHLIEVKEKCTPGKIVVQLSDELSVCCKSLFNNL